MPDSLSPNHIEGVRSELCPDRVLSDDHQLCPDRVSPNERLYAIDLIRYLSFLAILIFHMSFALYAPQGLTTIPAQNALGQIIEAYGRTLAFSGFTVLFLSFFLFGFKPSHKLSRLPFYILLFAAVWSATVEVFPYWWDIYPFLIVVLLALKFAQKIKPEYLALAAGTLLSIPLWNLEPFLANYLNSALAQISLLTQSALLGACQTRADLGDWPLLPWAAYPIFAFAIGKLAQQNRTQLKTIQKPETFVWLIALSAAATQWGKYYVTPLGEEFGCSVFRQSPLTFWAHQVPIFLILRLSLLTRIQETLKNSSLAQTLTNRPINQYFFLIYFAHYPLAYLIQETLTQAHLTNKPYTFALATLTLLATVEFGPVVIRRILPHNQLRSVRWLRVSEKSSITSNPQG